MLPRAPTVCSLRTPDLDVIPKSSCKVQRCNKGTAEIFLIVEKLDFSKKFAGKAEIQTMNFRGKRVNMLTCSIEVLIEAKCVWGKQVLSHSVVLLLMESFQRWWNSKSSWSRRRRSWMSARTCWKPMRRVRIFLYKSIHAFYSQGLFAIFQLVLIVESMPTVISWLNKQLNEKQLQKKPLETLESPTLGVRVGGCFSHPLNYLSFFQCVWTSTCWLWWLFRISLLLFWNVPFIFQAHFSPQTGGLSPPLGLLADVCPTELQAGQTATRYM